MQTHENHKTQLGVIEGFFGREWRWEDRIDYATFLAQQEYDFYIYAPKSDKHLRTQWQIDWPHTAKQKLHDLRNAYSAAGIAFGIGLSPHEIYLNNTQHQREALKQRVQQLNQLTPDILCILFDDMRGDVPGLADIQIDIAHEVAELSLAKKIIFCPTYYSFDPVLEKVFGTIPENYWQTFAQRLDKQIDLFWTGEKVCSAHYSREHLAEVAKLIGRKPFLWDNYPVNDGAVKSNLLHLRAVDKSRSQLEGQVAGHAANPMNQAWLSKIPLASLALAYQLKDNYSPTEAFIATSEALCGAAFAHQLASDISALQERGLQQLDNAEKSALRKCYGQYADNPFAQEIIDWLDNVYEFDPACLTE